MRRRTFRYRWFSWVDVMVWLGLSACLIIGLVLGLRECDEKAECERRGGEVVQHNCRLVSTGKTIIYACDWRCEGD